jgi:hypothetical protein
MASNYTEAENVGTKTFYYTPGAEAGANLEGWKLAAFGV